MAYWLRYNLGEIPDHFLRQAFVLLPFVVCIQGAVFVFFGLYRGVWRFASVPDLIRILKAVFFGTAFPQALIEFLKQAANVRWLVILLEPPQENFATRLHFDKVEPASQS